MTAPRKALPRWPQPLRWFHGQIEARAESIVGHNDEIAVRDVRRLNAWLTRYMAAYDARKERP